MVDSRYDGRKPEPPYDCPSCLEKDAVIRELAVMCVALKDGLQVIILDINENKYVEPESKEGFIAEATRRVEGKTK